MQPGKPHAIGRRKHAASSATVSKEGTGYSQHRLLRDAVLSQPMQGVVLTTLCVVG
jgi:hypothetical protein